MLCTPIPHPNFSLNTMFLSSPSSVLVECIGSNEALFSLLRLLDVVANRSAYAQHHTCKRSELICTKSQLLPVTLRCTHHVSVYKRRQDVIGVSFPLPPSLFYALFHVLRLSASSPFVPSLVYKSLLLTLVITATRLFYNKELNCSTSEVGLATFERTHVFYSMIFNS